MNKFENECLIDAIKRYDAEFNKQVCEIQTGKFVGTKEFSITLGAKIYHISNRPVYTKTYHYKEPQTTPIREY